MTEQRHDVEVDKVQRSRDIKDWWCICSCGASWRIPHMQNEGHMDWEVQETITKHQAYFNRPTTRVD